MLNASKKTELIWKERDGGMQRIKKKWQRYPSGFDKSTTKLRKLSHNVSGHVHQQWDSSLNDSSLTMKYYEANWYMAKKKKKKKGTGENVHS